MADGLPRHAKRTAELFLPDALPGSKRAVGNRFDQPLIGAVDQRRLQIERPQADIPAIEFRILLWAFQACASTPTEEDDPRDWVYGRGVVTRGRGPLSNGKRATYTQSEFYRQ